MKTLWPRLPDSVLSQEGTSNGFILANLLESGSRTVMNSEVLQIRCHGSFFHRPLSRTVLLIRLRLGAIVNLSAIPRLIVEFVGGRVTKKRRSEAAI